MRLTTNSRILVALSILLMLGAFFLPIWSIQLYAPQYPEGLGLDIWMTQIVGLTDFDLQNINLLNHYIGMAPIEPHGIPEFSYAPYILAGLIMLAFVVMLTGKTLLLYIEFACVSILGLIGMLDFFRWEYNYGHNLSAEAPIQIPGMSYQPPFLGCKQLLNIIACSFPNAGGWLLFSVGAILFIAIILENWRRVKNT